MEAPTSHLPEPTPVGDEHLMIGIQERKPEALADLYDRYSGILKSLIMGVIHNDAEADDLLQEIFMEIWNQAAHYSAQKGKPLGWIVTLTRRRSIDRLRKKTGLRPRRGAAAKRDRAATRRLGP